YLRAYTVFATADFAERVHEIAAPMLVVTGEDDIAATPRMARLMQARARAAELHLLAGLRHSVLIEAPAEVAALLRAFFGHGGRGHAGAAGLEPAQ
ncbi:MAG: alpha/beta fold hydrolase, partial [Lautropia sp.]